MSPAHGPFQRLSFALAGSLGRWLIGLYYLTVRIVQAPSSLARLNRSPAPSGIYAFWHAQQLSMLWHYRRSGAAILISASRDGEYIARIAKAVGYRPVRGSTSRLGAAGLKEMIRHAGEGKTVAFTPDGPRGPRHSVQPGVLAVAQQTGCPIVPTAVGLSDFWELPSWDRFRVPKPFARGWSCWGEPLYVPADADAAALRRMADELRRRMIDLQADADRIAKERFSRRG